MFFKELLVADFAVRRNLLSNTVFTKHVIIGLSSIVAGLKTVWWKSTTVIFEFTLVRGI